MPVIGQRIHLRLFLEGVEVPVVSAFAQSQKNAPAVCSIQLPANDYAMDLLPRTRVWLFNYDVYNGAPPAEQVSLGGPGVRVEAAESRLDPELNGLYPPERLASTGEQTLADLENENYKYMFGGEVVGINYMKTPTSRCVVLQCVDWSNYWDIAYQYQLSGFELTGGGIKAAFTGAGTTVFNDFLEGSGDIVAKLINTPPRSYPNLGGTLLGAITHIIEAIGGVYYGPRSIRGTNDFFSLAEMSLHITQMLGVNPYSSKDESRLLAANGFGSLFTRALSGLGKLVSIRQVLMALQKYIFHEIIPITSPRFIPALYDPNFPQFETVSLEADPDTKMLADTARTLKSRAEEMIERQEASTDAESATAQSNRRGGLITELRKLQRLAHDASVRAASSAATGEISAAFIAAGGEFGQIELYTRPVTGSGAHRFHWGDASGSLNRVILHCQGVVNQMNVVLASQHKKKITRLTRQPDPPARLITQIYRPDVWMVAPPRCNVWFPELYSSFNYGRQFQSEVTRLLLRTHSAFYGSDQFFDGYYIAPGNPKGVRSGKNIGRGRAAPNVTTARDTTGPANIDMPAWVLRDLMDHELYTGIIPSFERMSDLNLHAIRGGQVEVNGVKVDYAQLAANHIFFQYRFRSRDLSLSGKFNPYAVLGFPSLVVDKYQSSDVLREKDYDSALANRLRDAINDGEAPGAGMPADEQSLILEANAARTEEAIRSITSQRPNTHFLGTPAVLSHNVDASRGGTTTVQMEYARTTNERAEFLSDNIGVTPRVKRKKNTRFATELAALHKPELGTVGPRGGEIVEVTDITDRYTRAHARLQSTNRTATGRERYKGGTKLPLFVPDRRAQGRVRRGTQVLVGVEQPASSYDPEVVALVGSGGITDAATQQVLISFRAFRVVENIGVYVREQVELAPEDYTFPPWYGESYRSNRIGALYAYFFGTGSITDPLVVSEPGAAPRNPIPGMDDAALNLLLNRELGEAVLNATRNSTGPQPGFSDVPNISEAEFLGRPSADPLDPAQALNESVMGRVEFRSDLAEAVEEIVGIYSKVKTQGFDVHEFLRAYTWRPIASIVDILGSANLQISDDGEVLAGTEGFHSRAFGDFDDLRQLVGAGDGVRPQRIMGQTTVETATGFENATAISARMDTRKEKRTVVLSYLYSVLASRGILG